MSFFLLNYNGTLLMSQNKNHKFSVVKSFSSLCLKSISQEIILNQSFRKSKRVLWVDIGCSWLVSVRLFVEKKLRISSIYYICNPEVSVYTKMVYERFFSSVSPCGWLISELLLLQPRMSIRESLSSDWAWWKSHGTEMSNRARPVVAAWAGRSRFPHRQNSAGLSGSGEYSDTSLAFSFSPDVFLAEHAWVDAFIRGSYNQWPLHSQLSAALIQEWRVIPIQTGDGLHHIQERSYLIRSVFCISYKR